MKELKDLQEDKRLLIEKLKWIRFFVILILLIGICVYVHVKYQAAEEPEITSSFVNGKLETVSSLTTAELAYTGLIKYSQGNIPFLTQNRFSMIYTAKVQAGIDLSQAQIKITGDEVRIILPECSVQSIEVDPDSIEFYDEHWALFNWTEKKDVIDTVKAARDDVSQKADMDSLMKSAREQTEKVIQGLLSDAVGDKKLVIK